jgi:undecaprenyl diphosphate synthase
MTESQTPHCIGIILDGNRRWAREQGLASLEGHQQGAEAFKRIVYAVRDRGVAHLAAYAFSTENWNRPDEEVSYLMDLFLKSVSSHMEELAKEDVQIRIVGQRARFSEKIQKAFAAIEEKSAHNTRLTVWICLSYGGRSEIVEAARSIALSGEDVTETTLEQHMWTADMPNADIIIRTGGEKRLSGFLTWKSVYSELFFVDTYWPAFTESHLDAILEEYAQRERRHGK